jgi:hypothetical protein
MLCNVSRTANWPLRIAVNPDFSGFGYGSVQNDIIFAQRGHGQFERTRQKTRRDNPSGSLFRPIDSDQASAVRRLVRRENLREAVFL